VQRYEDSDRTYHGTKAARDDEPEWGPVRIIVECPEVGPTEREDVKVPRELRPPSHKGFGWGYNGHGTSYAAAAILADALNVEQAKFAAATVDDLDWQLREDFCTDVLATMCGEWRLRRGAVLRWLRGWYAQHEISELPAAVATLPPIHIDKQSRPR
jgi:hypothetical protein